MTKIFITIPWFSPAFRAGGPIQSIENLVRQPDNEIIYFIFCGSSDINGERLNVHPNKWLQYNEHTSVWYASGNVRSSFMHQLLEIKPSILYIIGLFSWKFNIIPMLFGGTSKRIVSTRGMLHPGALSQKKWKKNLFLSLFQLFGYHHKVQFHATDIKERHYIEKYLGEKVSIVIAANFPNNISVLPLQGKTPGHLKLITIALISPMKNVSLVLEALSDSNGKLDIEYDVYGPIKDQAYWKYCLKLISDMPENIKVKYHGEIERATINGVLTASHIFILPSKSENFGHSIIEALSAGRPVITSHNTPWNDLKQNMAGLNVSENADELADAIQFFTGMDAETLNDWSSAANRFAINAIDINKIKKQYQEMFFGNS